MVFRSRVTVVALNAALNKALERPDMKKNLELQGMAPNGGTSQRYGERIRKTAIKAD
jgi:tripartite-type tricarboxylate transporter receptor subunit TctC